MPSHTSSSTVSMSAKVMAPALLTSTSMRPPRSSAAATSRSGASSASTSPATVATRQPMASTTVGGGLQALLVAPGQDQVAVGVGERLGQREADPLARAGDDAAVAAQVEQVFGRHRERHGVILQTGSVGGYIPATAAWCVMRQKHDDVIGTSARARATSSCCLTMRAGSGFPRRTRHS